MSVHQTLFQAITPSCQEVALRGIFSTWDIANIPQHPKQCAHHTILNMFSIASSQSESAATDVKVSGAPRFFYSHDDVIKWKHFPRYWSFCAGNSPVTGEFPSQRPVTRSFDVFYLRLNKRFSEQSSGRWFETTPSCPLWRHSNVSWLHQLSTNNLNGGAKSWPQIPKLASSYNCVTQRCVLSLLFREHIKINYDICLVPA